MPSAAGKARLEAVRQRALLGAETGEQPSLLARLVERLARPFVGRQVAVNQAVVDSGVELCDDVAALSASVEQLVARLGLLDSALVPLITAPDRIGAVEGALGAAGRSIEGIVARLDALEPSRSGTEQTLAHHYQTLEHHTETLVRQDQVLEAHEN
ncbi:MAG TPA: hypothetical protein VMD59_02985, partial [Acidimicrobiales bacterium]|nr:hypothetical protein [Acidimicrobiales bacterium]